MTYRAPVEEMLFAMKYAGGLLDGIEHGIYTDLADGAAEALLDEAAKFAENRLAPINPNGRHGAAAPHKCGLHRNVERGQYGVCALSTAWFRRH